MTADAASKAESDPNETIEAKRYRVLLHVSYDGTSFSGFALQNNAETISGILERAISEIDPEAGLLTGSSRTDKGVHALGQPVSFTTKKSIASRGWVLALGQRMPPTISIIQASQVPLDFDPRRDALWKRYRYRLLRSQVEDPFSTRTSWRIGQRLDLEKMQDEARYLVGTHDFRAFRSAEDVRPTTIRTITELSVSTDARDPRRIDVVVCGNRFMYNMVRIIVGTLVDVGRGKLAPGCFARALSSGNRQDLGMTAPARGLMLEHVELQTTPENSWPPSAAY